MELGKFDNTEDNNSNDKDNKSLIYICIAVFLLLVSIFILVFVSKAIEDIKIEENANFEKVEATIVEYKKYIKNSKVYYSTYYEYKSPDGVIYSGFWNLYLESEEEAISQLGKKVPLYVDNELKLQQKTVGIDKTGVIIGSIIGTIFLIISLSIFIDLIIKFVRWRKNNPIAKGEKEARRSENPPKNFSGFHLGIMVFALFIATGVIGSSVSQEENYKTYVNARFVEVEAEIYDYKQFEEDESVYYATYYKFVDKDGKVYDGMWSNNIESKEEAQGAIGSKVILYYDKNYGAIKSMLDIKPVEKPEHMIGGIVITVCIILFINSLVRFIRFFVLNERYKQMNDIEDD